MSGPLSLSPASMLLIEDNPGDVRMIQELLRDAGVDDDLISMEMAASLESGLDRLAQADVDVVLADLNLPDSHALATYDSLQSRNPDVPIVILTSLADDEVAIKAVQQGAQDYLVKGEVDGSDLKRALRYAIERHRVQKKLEKLAQVDELTGLYNRRGFIASAERQIETASRTSIGVLVLLLDVDDLKSINDRSGHGAGDRALVDVAQALRSTFRASDVLGRWGGDEFVAIATGAHVQDAERITARIEASLRAVARSRSDARVCEISIGSTYYDCQGGRDVVELIAEADAAMYAGREGEAD